MQTIFTALQSATAELAAISDTPRLDAQIILENIINKDRSFLLAHGETPLSEDEATQFTELVRLRAMGEPIAYIVGKRAFYDREIAVTRGVLIPRPETEHLLEEALAFVAQKPDAQVVDVGTGSGALAVTLAANAPQAHVYATDISPMALVMTRYNAFLNKVNLTSYEGHLLDPLIERQIRVDVLMANLPYIATEDLADLEVSRHEPRTALDGGPNGLDLVRELLEQAPQVCQPGALILLEIGADQGPAALALVQAAFPDAEAEILKDYAQLDRIIKARLPL
jgi:release factor glutamine methyltransferase